MTYKLSAASSGKPKLRPLNHANICTVYEYKRMSRTFFSSPVLLGHGTVTGNLFPHAVLPDESIGTEHSLDAVFAPDHSIIGIGISRDRGVVVVDADFEIADLFAVHFIIGRVFRIRHYGFLRCPDSTAEAAGPVVGVILLDER